MYIIVPINRCVAKEKKNTTRDDAATVLMLDVIRLR